MDDREPIRVKDMLDRIQKPFGQERTVVFIQK